MSRACAERLGAPPVVAALDIGSTKLAAVIIDTDGRVQAVRDVSFSVQPGERVGIVGESGFGETITGLSLLGLLPAAATQVTGEAML